MQIAGQRSNLFGAATLSSSPGPIKLFPERAGRVGRAKTRRTLEGERSSRLPEKQYSTQVRADARRRSRPAERVSDQPIGMPNAATAACWRTRPTTIRRASRLAGWLDVCTGSILYMSAKEWGREQRGELADRSGTEVATAPGARLPRRSLEGPTKAAQAEWKAASCQVVALPFGQHWLPASWERARFCAAAAVERSTWLARMREHSTNNNQASRWAAQRGASLRIALLLLPLLAPLLTY